MLDSLADARDALKALAQDAKLGTLQRDKFSAAAKALGVAEQRILALELVVRGLVTKTGLVDGDVSPDRVSRVFAETAVKALLAGK